MKRNSLLSNLGSGSFFGNLSDLGYLPNPDRVLQKTGSTHQALRELKYDAHLWSCIQSRKSGVLNLDWSIVAENRKLSDDITKILKDINILQLMRDILEAPLFGFQPLEIIWEKTTAEKNKYIPKKIKPIPQEYFIFNRKGDMLYNEGNRYVKIPEYKLLTAKYESSAINPYGEALLSKCYWLVKFKNGGMKLWVSFMEKFGIPIISGKFNRGSTDEESSELLDNLELMSEGSVFVAPNDIDIDVIQANKSDATNLYKELIKNCNNEISKAILSQTLTTELDMGSYAAAQTHYKIRQEVIISDALIVEEIINKLILYYMNINYGDIKTPVFKFTLNNADDNSRMERDINLSKNNILKFNKVYWIKNYGFNSEDFDINPKNS